MNTVLLQVATNTFGFGSLLGFSLIIGFCFLIFLVLRAVMLWYWKVDKIVTNQQKQIEQLTTVIHQQAIMIDGLSAIYKKDKPDIRNQTEVL